MLRIASLKRWWGVGLIMAGGAVLGCGETKLLATDYLRGSMLVDSATGGADASELGSGSGAPVARAPESVSRQTPNRSLYVEGAYLRDHCGSPLIMRGATEMVIWSEDRDGSPEFSEMAKTGANAVRIVWLLDGSPGELDVALSAANNAGLVPVLEFHDAFHDLSDAAALEEITAYLTSDEVVAVIERHEKAMVIELEGKEWTESEPAEWARLFGHAIIDLRAAGIVVPIAVHEPSWGSELAEVREHVPAALSQDPLKNSLYATAVWDGYINRLRETIELLGDEGVALYISGFSGFEAYRCPRSEVDVSALLGVAAEFEVGWFAWSWGGVQNIACGGNGFLDMTTDGSFESLAGWGLVVATTDPHSLAANTIPLSTSELSQCPVLSD